MLPNSSSLNMSINVYGFVAPNKLFRYTYKVSFPNLGFKIIFCCVSYSRWRMLAWGCGLSSSTAPHQSNTPTAGSFVNTDVWRVTIRLTTNRLDRWFACGTTWLEANPAVAILDDVEAVFTRYFYRFELIDPIIICPLNSSHVCILVTAIGLKTRTPLMMVHLSYSTCTTLCMASEKKDDS